VASTRGEIYTIGDAEREFAIMSVSKPFVFALVAEPLGVEEVRERVGINATGLAFNSPEGHRSGSRGPHEPDGELGGHRDDQPRAGRDRRRAVAVRPRGLSCFAGRTLPLNDEVYASASETNRWNQGIGRLLQSYGRIYMDPAEAVDLCTKQCALNVTAQDLAVMGATLADGGVNPHTRERVVDAAVCH
jgi:glutaminase